MFTMMEKKVLLNILMMLLDLDSLFLPLEYFRIAGYALVVSFMGFVMEHLLFRCLVGNKDLIIYKSCILVMEEESYAANGIKHCVRPCDMTGKSAAIILR
jgi:hypothetical protein